MRGGVCRSIYVVASDEKSSFPMWSTMNRIFRPSLARGFWFLPMQQCFLFFLVTLYPISISGLRPCWRRASSHIGNCVPTFDGSTESSGDKKDLRALGVFQEYILVSWIPIGFVISIRFRGFFYSSFSFQKMPLHHDSKMMLMCSLSLYLQDIIDLLSVNVLSSSRNF